MKTPDQFIFCNFLIDTNCINAKQAIPELNYLEELASRNIITIIATETVNSELKPYASGTKKSNTMVYSINCSETIEEQDIRQRIEYILFPSGAKNKNQANDIDIVFNAFKYKRILITHDGGSKKQPGGILGHREELRNKFNILVMTAKEAVCFVNEKIDERKAFARKIDEKLILQTRTTTMTNLSLNEHSNETELLINIQETFLSYKEEGLPKLRAWKLIHLADAVMAYNIKWYRLCAASLELASEPIEKISDEKWVVENIQKKANAIDEKLLDSVITQILSELDQKN